LHLLYLNAIKRKGQHLEHSPFCERDFILPTELETHDEKAILIKIKKEVNDAVVYATHPLTLLVGTIPSIRIQYS
jgi:homogentisate 1,2-dioxygenase